MRHAPRIREGHVRWGTFLRMHKKRKPLLRRKVLQQGDFLSNLDAYGRQAVLYYSGPEHREFKELTGELVQRFGTKNQSDTVLFALRALMSVSKAIPY